MKRPEVKMIECPLCNGRGVKPDSNTGALMRLERESRAVTRNALLPYFYKPESTDTYSEGYLIDLEKDSRAWSVELISSFRNAIEMAVQARLAKAEEVNA